MVSQTPIDSGRPVVAFAGGGTGGHLFPALAIAEVLADRLSGVRFLFFGTQRRLDQRLVRRGDCELIPQSLQPLCRAPWRWPGILADFHRSSRMCRSRFESDHPVVVIGTGGFSSVPAVREAHRAGIPTVLLNPDAIPGRANRHLAGLADIICVQWEEAADHLPRSNLVILAVPVDAIPHTLERIAPYLTVGAVVTDVGSTKAWVLEQAAELIPAGVQFIGGHPVAGSERSGVGAADPLTFRGRTWVLSPYPETPPGALHIVTALVQDLLATPIILEPDEHDRLLALTSHAPQLLATALMHAAIEADTGDGLLEIIHHDSGSRQIRNGQGKRLNFQDFVSGPARIDSDVPLAVPFGAGIH